MTARNIASTVGYILGFILGLVILASLGYASWLLSKAVLAGFAAADSTVLAAFITAGFVVVGAAWAKYLEHSNSVKAQFRESKSELYNEVLEVLENLSGNNMPPEELATAIKKWKRKTMFWGSPKVVRALLSLGNTGKMGTDVGDVAARTQMLGTLLLAMRKDVGLSNRGICPKRYGNLSKGTILAAYHMIKHPDLFLSTAQSTPSMSQAEYSKLERLAGLELE
ncbi:MAG: hypothetical protein OXD46_02335 [Chloroflexi bacterium]|nr:hypothetical protein [Chloroflexota bacterium]